MRLALGLSYLGQAYDGWQSQPSGNTVQDRLELALARFCEQPVSTVCAGRTDSGVHGLQQVVHFDTELSRDAFSWVRGTNTFLPADIAVQWAQPVPREFHSRASAMARRYTYLCLDSPVRPSLENGRVGWVFKPLQLEPMQAAARHLVGEHDFSSFRAAACQALSPIKTLHSIQIQRIGHRPDVAYWRFDFEGNAFLHHMIRNIMGCLVWVGQGLKPADWMAEVLAAKNRQVAAPTFAAEGLYFVGPVYDARWGLPNPSPAYDGLLGSQP